MKQLELKKINVCLSHTHKIPEKHLISGKLTDNDLILLDEYVDYIYSIIDESDYIFFNMDNDEDMLKTLNGVNYEYYDKVFIDIPVGVFGAHYLFDIKDFESKWIVKDNFKFNLSDDEREPYNFNVDRDYIINDDKRIEISMLFVKNGYLIGDFSIGDGYFYDYRDIPNNPWVPVYDEERSFDIKEDFRYKIPKDYIKISELIIDEEKFNNYWNKVKELIDSSFMVYIHSNPEMINKLSLDQDYFYNLYINNELVEEKISSCVFWEQEKKNFLEEFKKNLKEDNSFDNQIVLKRDVNKEYECYYFADRFEKIIGVIYKYNGLLYDYRSNLIKKKTK